MTKVSDEGKRIFQEIADQVLEGTGRDLKRIQNNFPLESGFRGKARVAWHITDPDFLSEGDVDDVVVKFPQSEQGKTESKTEVSEWRNIPDSLKSHLADLLDWDINGNWILQEKVETSQEVDPDQVNEVRSNLLDEGFRVRDLKSSDVGVNDDGNPVLVDWGEGFEKVQSEAEKILEQISGFPELKEKLENETFAIITAEAPQGDVDPKVQGSQESRQKQLRQDLQKLDPTELKQITGKYDGVQENPYFVSGIGGDKKQILRLGNKYGQDSVIWGENGKYELISSTGNPGEVVSSTSNIVKVEGDENFSRMEGVKFRFDFF